MCMISSCCVSLGEVLDTATAYLHNYNQQHKEKQKLVTLVKKHRYVCTINMILFIYLFIYLFFSVCSVNKN